MPPRELRGGQEGPCQSDKSVLNDYRLKPIGWFATESRPWRLKPPQRVSKLRQTTFETAIIERYRRRESSVEEALIEMYLAGASVRRVESITGGTRVSPSRVSKLNKKIYKHIEAWRTRPIEGEYPCVYLDGVVLQRSWGGEVRNLSVLVAIGVGLDGHRVVLGVAERGPRRTRRRGAAFCATSRSAVLGGMRLIISDACVGLVESVAEFFPDAQWQRCAVRFYRNVMSHVPSPQVREVARMLKAIHAQEDREAARGKAAAVAARLRHIAGTKWGTRRYLTMELLTNPEPEALAG